MVVLAFVLLTHGYTLSFFTHTAVLRTFGGVGVSVATVRACACVCVRAWRQRLIDHTTPQLHALLPPRARPVRG